MPKKLKGYRTLLFNVVTAALGGGVWAKGVWRLRYASDYAIAP